jgi:hypothetical protein
MGIVRDITVDQLTQAVNNIDTSTLAQDSTLQDVVTAIGNISSGNDPVTNTTVNTLCKDTTGQSIASAITALDSTLGANKADIDGSNIANPSTFRNAIGAGLERRTRQDITSRLTNLSNAASEQNLSKYNYTIGDYFTGASGYTYYLADMDTFYGGTAILAIINTHHIALVVDTNSNSKWANSDDTSRGYTNSVLQSYLNGTVLNNIKSDFISLFGGSTGLEHLASHNLHASTGLSSWAWTSAEYISALTEIQAYGSTVWSPTGFQTGEAFKPIALFQKYRINEIIKNNWVWLRDAYTTTNACAVSSNGDANTTNASYNNRAVGLVLFH